MGILAWIVLGLVVGAIAKAIMGGDGGWLSSLILGIVGALVGGFIGRVLFNTDIAGFFNLRTWLLAILGAVVVMFVWGMVTGRRKV